MLFMSASHSLFLERLHVPELQEAVGEAHSELIGAADEVQSRNPYPCGTAQLETEVASLLSDSLSQTRNIRRTFIHHLQV